MVSLPAPERNELPGGVERVRPIGLHANRVDGPFAVEYHATAFFANRRLEPMTVLLRVDVVVEIVDRLLCDQTGDAHEHENGRNALQSRHVCPIVPVRRNRRSTPHTRWISQDSGGSGNKIAEHSDLRTIHQ